MSLVSRIARSSRPWLSLYSRSPRQCKAMVLYGALHSLPPSLAKTVSATPASNFREVPQDMPGPGPGLSGGRDLVLCFDGTGEQYDEDITSIVRFFGLLAKEDPSRQMVYYQAGIGTGISSSAPSNSLLKKVDSLLDQAFATGLPVHVRGGYEFLMNNYKKGDRISLFGFSRGAYTARALAGMLQKVGLLPAHNKEQIKYAYRMFKRDDEVGWKLSEGFKNTFSIKVKIDFVGVFDTVDSVGIIIPKELPFATSNHLIRVFRHAVALDERRVRFKAHHWGCAAASERKMEEGYKRENDYKSESRSLISQGLSYATRWMSTKPTTVTRDGSRHLSNPETDVQEIWFAGAHSDVGGGAVSNETVNHLAQIPLRWMIRECIRETSIVFDDRRLEAVGLDRATLLRIKHPTPPESNVVGLSEGSPAHYEGGKSDKATNLTATDASRPSISQVVPDVPVRLNTVEDEKDAVQNIHDRLSRRLRWWILELLPLKHRMHDGTLQWIRNRGRPRTFPIQKDSQTRVHKSVLYRMQQKPEYDLKLKGMGLFEKPGVKWVD